MYVLVSRKSAAPDNSLLRSRERGVVVSRRGGVLYSPPRVCQEVWDLQLPHRKGLLAAEIGGRSFGNKGVPTEEMLRQRLSPVATDIAAAVNAVSGSSAVKGATPWDETTRFFWADTNAWLLGGGVTESGFGDQLASHANRILGNEFSVRVSPQKRWSGLAGSAEFLPPSSLDPASTFTNYLGLDLGGSSLKISLVRVVSRTGKTAPRPFNLLRIEERPADLPFTDEIEINSMEYKLKGSRRVTDWIAGSIVKMIIAASRRGIKLAPHLVMGVAFEVDEKGRRISGGTYPFPSRTESDFSLTREIEKRIAQLLKDVADNGNVQSYSVIPVNDAIMAAAGSLPDDLQGKFGYLGLGSGVGGALYVDPADPRYSRCL